LATADAVEFFAQWSSTTAVVAANLTLQFTPDDRGYSKFNRSAIRFCPILAFQKFGMNHVFLFASVFYPLNVGVLKLIKRTILPPPSTAYHSL
jgi:hypothetical protein